jgi:hypothetical protein
MRVKSPSTRDALTRATLSAVSSRSTATARQATSSDSRLTAMHPLPVPRSSSVPRAGPCCAINDSAVSTSCQTMTRVNHEFASPACDTYHFSTRTRYERTFDRCHLAAILLYQGCISHCISLYQGRCVGAHEHVSPERLVMRDVAQWLASYSSCRQSNRTIYTR